MRTDMSLVSSRSIYSVLLTLSAAHIQQLQVDMFAADGSPNSLPRLRLRSMYAEKPEDNLLFQVQQCVTILCDYDALVRVLVYAVGGVDCLQIGQACQQEDFLIPIRL